MRLAISTYSLSRWIREQNKSLNQAIDWIAEHAKGIEFSGPDPAQEKNPARKAKALRKRAEDKGLTVVGYNCPGELLVTDDAELRRRVDALKRNVDFAAELGAPNMRHDVTRGFPEDWSGKSKTFAVALKRVVPAVREIAEYAQERGVKTTIENHGFYMQASDRVEKLIKAVDHPNYGLTLDIGNFLCVNENPVDAVKRLAGYTTIAHIKDFHVKDKKVAPAEGWFQTPTKIALRGAIVGHGEIDLPTCLKTLKRAGYDSWLTLEFEGQEEPTKGVEMGLTYAQRLIDSL